MLLPVLASRAGSVTTVAGRTSMATVAVSGNEITPTGTRGYCADPSRAAPFGSTDGGAAINSFTSDSGHMLDGDDMQKVNYVLQRFGDTSDDIQAAAVSAYVYAFTGSNLGGGIVAGTREEGAAYIDSGFGTVTDRYNQIWDDAEANWNMGASSPGGGLLTFSIDADNFRGTVTAAVFPAGATGSINLTNGIFTSTGSATMTGVTAGQTFDISGVPSSETDVSFRVSGSGSFTTGGESKTDSNLVLFTTGAEQRLLSAGSSSPTSTSFTVSGADGFDRSILFAPVVGTAVASKFVAAGEKPQDRLTFRATSFVDKAGRTVANPWGQSSSGAFRIVKAEGTLYGPSLRPFAPASTPPVGTPVSGHASVSTDAKDGPNRSYVATSDSAIRDAGYYAWVLSISAASQDDDTARFLPAGYSFTDEFGQVAETHVSPAALTFKTQVSASVVGLGGVFSDTITPTPGSGSTWLQVNGANIPVTLTGTIYRSTERPIQAATAPASAQVVGHVSKVITSSAAVNSPKLEAGYLAGFLTVQWSIQRAAQPVELQGMVSDWSDDYGIPAETVEVQPPTIVTTAQPISAPGGTVHDSATVSGFVPTVGLDISFVGYLPPEGVRPPCVMLRQSGSRVVGLPSPADPACSGRRSSTCRQTRSARSSGSRARPSMARIHQCIEVLAASPANQPTWDRRLLQRCHRRAPCLGRQCTTPRRSAAGSTMAPSRSSTSTSRRGARQLWSVMRRIRWAVRSAPSRSHSGSRIPRRIIRPSPRSSSLASMASSNSSSIEQAR